METIKPQNSLRVDQKKTKIKNEIIDKIKSAGFSNLDNLKNDNELLSLVMNLIENSIKKKYKIDKKELLLDIYGELYPNLTQDEKMIIIKNHQFLFENDFLAKIKSSTYVFNFLKNLIIKKLS